MPGIQHSYVSNLERLTKSFYIDNLEADFGQEMNHFHQILTGYLEKGIFGDIPPLPWSDLRLRASVLTKNLRSPQPIQGNYKSIQTNGINYLQLDLANLMVVPVELKELIIAGTIYPVDQGWCEPESCQEKTIGDESALVIADHRNITLTLPMADINFDFELDPDPQIYVIANLWAGSTVTENPILSNYTPGEVSTGSRPRATLEYALNNHLFLDQTAQEELFVSPGSWQVDGDLVIPDGFNLSIPAGVSLFFDTNAALIVNGSLNLSGSLDEPVLLAAKDISWEGIYALGNSSIESNWTHVEVRNTAGILRGGWVLTGGITFYENDLHLQHVQINENYAEDA